MYLKSTNYITKYRDREREIELYNNFLRFKEIPNSLGDLIMVSFISFVAILLNKIHFNQNLKF